MTAPPRSRPSFLPGAQCPLRDRAHWTVLALRVGHGAIAETTGLPLLVLRLVQHGDPGVVRACALRAFAVALAVPVDWLLGLVDVGPCGATLRRTYGFHAAHRASLRPLINRPDSRGVPRRQRLRSVLVGPVPAPPAASPRKTSPVTEVEPMNTVKDRLLLTLEAASISQLELARVAHLNASHVNDICRGRSSNVTATTLASIAYALGCSADWLLGLTAQGPRPRSVRERFTSLGGRVQLRPGAMPDAEFGKNVSTTSRRGRVRGARKLASADEGTEAKPE